MAYYLMITRRDDWGALHSYRFGRPIKDMKVAMTRCRKTLDSFVLNDKNECICINSRGSCQDASGSSEISTFSSLSPI